MRDGQREAAVDSLAVEQDRARAALAMVTTLFGAPDADAFPQKVQQRRARVDLEPMHPPVGIQGDLHVHAPHFGADLSPSQSNVPPVPCDEQRQAPEKGRIAWR